MMYCKNAKFQTAPYGTKILLMIFENLSFSLRLRWITFLIDFLSKPQMSCFSYRYLNSVQPDGPAEHISNDLAARLVQTKENDAGSFLSSNETLLSGVSSSNSTLGGKIVTFCPARCICDISSGNQLRVVCTGHFVQDFPLDRLRKDVEILKIEPELRCVTSNEQKEICTRTENQISLGPIYQHLRLLKELRIRHSQVISFSCIN